MMHRTIAIGILLVLAGCSSQPEAPVLGAWQGTQPGSNVLSEKNVDLVLRGLPDAQGGQYCLATGEHDPSDRVNQGQPRTGGAWARSQRVIDGRSVTVFHLNDTLPDDISSYALMPDGTLRGLNPNGTLGTTQEASLYALSPVPAGPRRGRV
jgi:hypothetical protein